ncbi:DUF2252 domain-containing protein [Streptomyces sp. NPDC087420]|uniref:DUF2252 domain-containing protein n=1 Tax=Streptomyces sp. NPDC087420 TaxID=3365785 RepID=UPI003838095A
MTTPADRALIGRAARHHASRSSHGLWIPPAHRTDPLAVLASRNSGRIAELLPLHYARMAASPSAFLRGAAAVMAADLAHSPRTGLTVQLCGDAHLLNFGFSASPERALLFDLNNFDETLPGPFEWDVKRLAASIAVAARDNGQPDGEARGAAGAAVEAYRNWMRRLADLGELDVWYRHLDTTDLLALVRAGQRGPGEADAGNSDPADPTDSLDPSASADPSASTDPSAVADPSAARHRTSLRALEKLTDTPGGRRRITPDPPVLEPVGRIDAAALRRIFIGYRSTLPEDRRVLLDRFRFVDAARQVVGVGGVGVRCHLVLLEGRDSADPLFLQIKEAGRSALDPPLPRSAYEHQGHRVVAGQRLLQAAADPFLGWVTGPEGRHFYWRQLRDVKGASSVGDLTPALLLDHARLCGTALARAHARSGDRIAIAAYLGGADTFDRAVADFALRYADRTALDHAGLRAVLASGRIPATS